MESCLANTGSNIALYAAIAGVFLIISAISLLFVKNHTHYRYRGGMLSLILLAGIVTALFLTSTSAFAATTNTNCDPNATQTSTNTNNQNGGGQTAALTCPENWIVVPGNSTYNTSDFCVMKYAAKNSGGTVTDTNDFGNGFISNTYSGGTAVSTATGQPWANISQTDAITAATTAGSGAHLITENQWMTIAHNVMANPANWCDADGSNCGNAPGTSGKILANGNNDGDNNQPLEASTDDTQACFGTVTPGVNTACGSEAGTQKRTLTLSNGEVIWDFAGNIWQWTAGTETQGNLPSNGGSSSCCEYNADFDNWGTLAYINPAVYNPSAAAWGTAQGVGFLYSNFSSGSPTVIAFGRGGGWNGGSYAGAFALFLEVEPSDFDYGVGFRAAL